MSPSSSKLRDRDLRVLLVATGALCLGALVAAWWPPPQKQALKQVPCSGSTLTTGADGQAVFTCPDGGTWIWEPAR